MSAVFAVVAQAGEGTEHAAPGLRRDPDIVLDAQGVEDALNLQGARQSQLADAMRRKARNVLAAETHLPGGCRQRTGDDVEERRLAGAVWTDNGVQLVRFQAHVDIVECPEATEMFRQAVNFQQSGHALAPERCGLRLVARLAAPFRSVFAGATRRSGCDTRIEPVEQRIPGAHKPPGCEDDGQDDDNADEDRIVLPHIGELLAHDDHEASPEHRAENGSRTTDQHPDNAFTGHVIEHVGGGRVSSEQCEQASRQPGQRARGNERGQAQQIDVEADHLRARVVFPHRDQSQSQGAADKPVFQIEGERHHAKHEIVLD